MSPTHTVLRNFEGLLVSYPEPGVDMEPAAGAAKTDPGVWELVSGKADVIQPAHTQRMGRREKIGTKGGKSSSAGYLFDT